MVAWENFKNQSEWEAYLKNLLKTNDKALLRSIIIIYENQTLEEKLKGTSLDENSKGFNRWDAEEMSNIAKKIKAKKKLKQHEMIHSRLVMPKYWKQLMVVSKQKLKEKEEKQKLLDEEEMILAKEKEEKQKQSEMYFEVLNKCFEEGTPCSYGICDECLSQ